MRVEELFESSMEPLGTDRFMTFVDDEAEIVNSNLPGLRVAASNGHVVRSYVELLRKVAALGYHNVRFKLLFRGQGQDYKLNIRAGSGVHSCLYPSILRPRPGQRRQQALDDAFARLAAAERLLTERIPDRAVREHQLVRWALLQHYQVCPTPLLDVTSSLQTALSFAVQDRAKGFLFVLAVPQPSGPVSVSIESMTQLIDLCQACPPEALRPHFQSAMLIGDYPTIAARENTQGRRGLIGNNFSCRLLAKFRLVECPTWKAQGFISTATRILFPDQDDGWFATLNKIKDEVFDRAA